MRSKTKHIQRILLSNFLLAAVLSIPLVIFVHVNNSPYTLKLVNAEQLIGKTRLIYHDINLDGTSESIGLLTTQGVPVLSVQNPVGRYYHESKFLGEFYQPSVLAFSDYNHNHTDEINFFLSRNDSVFLTWGELTLDRDPVFHQKFLFRVPKFN